MRQCRFRVRKGKPSVGTTLKKADVPQGGQKPVPDQPYSIIMLRYLKKVKSFLKKTLFYYLLAKKGDSNFAKEW